MRARIIVRGQTEDVTGRTVESIARTHFGRDAEVIPEHSELFDPPTTTWTVVSPAPHPGSGRPVHGRIVTDNRGPGRPVKPRAGTADVLIRRMPLALKAEIESSARGAGRSLSEEIINRLCR